MIKFGARDLTVVKLKTTNKEGFKEIDQHISGKESLLIREMK